MCVAGQALPVCTPSFNAVVDDVRCDSWMRDGIADHNCKNIKTNTLLLRANRAEPAPAMTMPVSPHPLCVQCCCPAMFAAIKGLDGRPGPTGMQGQQGLQGLQGLQGIAGPPGEGLVQPGCPQSVSLLHPGSSTQHSEFKAGWRFSSWVHTPKSASAPDTAEAATQTYTHCVPCRPYAVTAGPQGTTGAPGPAGEPGAIVDCSGNRCTVMPIPGEAALPGWLGIQGLEFGVEF